jgi:hypothetical protein
MRYTHIAASPLLEWLYEKIHFAYCNLLCAVI